MAVQLQNAELQRYLESEVRKGRFPSAEAVIEEALTRMKDEEESLPALDADLEARLARADEQVARGNVIEWSVAREELIRKYRLKM